MIDDPIQLGSDSGDVEQPDLLQLDGDGVGQGELLLSLHENGHGVGGWWVVWWRWACTLFEWRL